MYTQHINYQQCLVYNYYNIRLTLLINVRLFFRGK